MVRLQVPVLSRLILGELAERRGLDEAALLSELILAAAVRELQHQGDRPSVSPFDPPGHGDAE
jgi:hypothetical protein